MRPLGCSLLDERLVLLSDTEERGLERDGSSFLGQQWFVGHEDISVRVNMVRRHSPE
jgi:hypothetical protein